MANKDLWVFIEATECWTAKSVGIELLNPGKRLANAQGGELVAVILGKDNQRLIEDVKGHGADKIISVENPVFEHYNTNTFTNALAELNAKYEPATILIGATSNGRDLAPRLACRLKTGLTADCTSLDIDEETGNVIWTRPAMGGNLMAQIICPETRPQIGTVRPGIFKKPETDETNIPEVIEETVSVTEDDILTKVVERIRETGNCDIDITAADIIVAGGRGMKGEAGFTMLETLAKALGAAVGATRPAVEEGWIGNSHQIGQTGRTVSPKIYIACGISGAIQHTVGMEGSDMIIAINKDPEAPIFGVATYGIVGDAFEIIPELIRKLNK